jgi:hypothetical protein
LTEILERLVWALYNAHVDGPSHRLQVRAEEAEARASVTAEMKRLNIQSFLTEGTVACQSCGTAYTLSVSRQGDTVAIDDGLDGFGCPSPGCNY